MTHFYEKKLRGQEDEWNEDKKRKKCQAKKKS